MRRTSRAARLIVVAVIAVGLLVALPTAGPTGATTLPVRPSLAPPATITAWGQNQKGQLGDGTTDDSTVPIHAGASGPLAGKVITAVATGGWTTCAIADGAAYCWGSRTLGNSTATSSSDPVAVDTAGVLNGKTVTDITVGLSQACVVADGQAYCWGSGTFGELGDGAGTDSPVPVAVDTTGALAGKTVTDITAGDIHTCAIADGQPYCWGQQSPAQPAESPLLNSLVPLAVDTSGALAGKTVTAITAGHWHDCGLAAGDVYCWGRGTFGALGNGATADSATPVAVDVVPGLDGSTVTDLSGGANFTCVVAGGRPVCWGENFAGQLGTGSTTDSLLPAPVDISGALDGKPVTDIDAGQSHVCAVAAGRAFCWGANPHGELGDHSTTSRMTPTAVDTTGALDGRVLLTVDAGFEHSAGLSIDDPGFCDVTPVSPFLTDIAWLRAVGITGGFGDECFRPYDPVARQAMAAFIYRSTEPGTPDPTCTGTVRTFTDVPATNSFCGPIEWLADRGITTGLPDGTFKPTGTVARGMMAAFLHRTLVPETPDPTCTGTTRTFNDVSATNSFCGSIEWLATSGITTGYDDDSFRPSASIARQSMAAFLHRALT